MAVADDVVVDDFVHDEEVLVRHLADAVLTATRRGRRARRGLLLLELGDSGGGELHATRRALVASRHLAQRLAGQRGNVADHLRVLDDAEGAQEVAALVEREQLDVHVVDAAALEEVIAQVDGRTRVRLIEARGRVHGREAQHVVERLRQRPFEVAVDICALVDAADAVAQLVEELLDDGCECLHVGDAH